MSFRSTYRRRFRWMAVAFAALAIAVPGASAAIPWEAPAPADGATAETAGSSQPTVSAAGLPYGTVAGTVRVVPAPESTVPQPYAVSSPGIDWRDAGIGAAIGVSAGLVIGASLLLVGRRQEVPARV